MNDGGEDIVNQVNVIIPILWNKMAYCFHSRDYQEIIKRLSRDYLEAKQDRHLFKVIPPAIHDQFRNYNSWNCCHTWHHEYHQWWQDSHGDWDLVKIRFYCHSRNNKLSEWIVRLMQNLLDKYMNNFQKNIWVFVRIYECIR